MVAMLLRELTSLTHVMIRFTFMTALFATTNFVATAGCNCQNNGVTPYVTAEPSVLIMAKAGMLYGTGMPESAVHAPHPYQADGRRYPIRPGSGRTQFGEPMLHDRSLVPLVPGTVGQTYSRTSHPIPADKHPRIAMVAVRDHGRVANMSVHGMSGFRMSNGIWLFETDLPLIPGKESIVRVEARRDTHDIQPHDFKFCLLYTSPSPRD